MTIPPQYERASGVLLHVSSLPGPYGIGDLGPAAREWVDWLASTGTRYWQILPLGPPGLGNSPYSSISSQAGSVDLISPEALVADGFLDAREVRPIGEQHRVDYRIVRKQKRMWLEDAFARLSGERRDEFAEFRAGSDVAEYALFMALTDAHGGDRWYEWPDDLRWREPAALAEAGAALSEEIDFHAFTQFIFSRQLDALRTYARSRDVAVLGDVPLYVAPDSVDVWTNPHLFALDEEGRPSHVAGVPPDEFSDTGQLWGSPLYRWGQHAVDGYAWWADRLRAFFSHADVLRIDHFIGLVRYYAIDADRPDATRGEWLPGPGIEFFEAMEAQLVPFNLVVEDLGHLTPEVEELRLELGYPGMTLLQDVVSHGRDVISIASDQVVYTGTHDNDTAAGRYETGSESYRRSARRLLGLSNDATPEESAERMVDAAWGSDGVIAVAPVQDLLGLGSEARMNRPGTHNGNWEWRMRAVPPDAIANRLRALNEATDRLALP